MSTLSSVDLELAISLFPAPATTSTRPKAKTLPWSELAAALSTHERRANKDGRGWCFASYRPGTTRGNANVRAISGVGGDVDHGSLGMLEETQQRLADLGLAYALYSTYSNDPPDNCCFRVAVPFDRPLECGDDEEQGAFLARWYEVWQNANHHVFGGRLDAQTKDLSRMFYSPAAPPGVAVFAKIGEGRPLDWSALPVAPARNGHSPNGEAVKGAVDYLGYGTLDFVANGAPDGEQCGRALGATRAYLSAGYSVEDTAAKVWQGLQNSPCGDQANPWTYQHALEFARDLNGRKPTPLAPSIDLTIGLEPSHINGANGAGPQVPPPPRRTVDEVTATFGKWLHQPDPGLVLVTLGTIAANRMPGDPVWLLNVGPPGSGKTEVLQAARRLPNVHLAATITEPALLSGTPKKDKATGAKGGLLREVGSFGILLLKDFTSILSMHREQRAAALAALREIYDGSWTRHVGVDGGRTLHWEGKLGIIAGCTPTIDSHHSVMASMGERFVLYRLPEVEAHRQAEMALAHVGREAEMRAELAQAVSGLFATIELPSDPAALSDERRGLLIKLATLATRCRSAVERDSHSRDIELIPDPEAPGRLTLTLARIFGGMLAIGVSEAEVWRVLVKVGLDCMPAIRLTVFELLANLPDPLDTSTVATEVGYPTQTARRTLEDLAAHGVVLRYTGGQGKPDRWKLSEWAQSLYDAVIGSVPEMSAGGSV